MIAYRYVIKQLTEFNFLFESLRPFLLCVFSFILIHILRLCYGITDHIFLILVKTLNTCCLFKRHSDVLVIEFNIACTVYFDFWLVFVLINNMYRNFLRIYEE